MKNGDFPESCLFTRGYIENADPFFLSIRVCRKKGNLQVNFWILVEQVSWFPAGFMIPNHGPDGSEKFLASRVGFIQDAPKIEHLLHFVFTSCGLKTGERERGKETHALFSFTSQFV